MNDDSEVDPDYGKRAHITLGNTLHKPQDKRRRSTGSVLTDLPKGLQVGVLKD